jgi:hypothetical protein
MKLSPLAQIKLVAVLATAYVLLGCEAPPTSASEQTPPLSSAVPSVPMPDLVTVSNIAPEPTAAPQPAENEPAHGPVALSDHLQEVVKLAQSGVGDEVVLAYIQNSPVPFSPSPEEILYLTDLGISDVIITALVNHHGTPAPMAAQPPPAAPVNPNPPPFPAEPPPAEATYNPEPPMVYSSPPVVEYVTPPPAVDYNYFYSSLAPYGSWMEVPDYGWCWQPTVGVIQHDWRPYCHRGRWLDTDCGWYWQSDYSWGWAPFHYGRWFQHPVRGWCWRPDSVWAPAWVSWRYTDSHCGWAPLPPGAHYHSGVGFTYYGAHVGVGFGFGLHGDAWTFVPAHRFHEREIWQHRVPPAEQPHIFRESKVVNNYVVQNNTIVNRGVSDRVPALARSEPRKVIVRDLPERGGAAVRPDRLRQEGAQVVVYRPKPPVASQQNPRTAQGPAARPVMSQPTSVARPATGITPSAGTVGREVRTASPAGSSSELVAKTRPVPAEDNRPAVRALSAPTTPVRSEPARVSTPQTYRAPAPASNPSPSPALQRPAPTAMSPQYRQETPKPVTSVSPRVETTPAVRSAPPTAFSPQVQSVTPRPSRPAPSFSTTESRPNASWSQPAAQSRPAPSYSPPIVPSQPAPSYSPPPVQSRPAPSYSPPAFQSRPAPSYSAPAFQSRPAPSYSAPAAQVRPAPLYSPPAVQSRPAPSYSAPPSRPAPQSTAPASSSNNRRQN